VIRSKGLTRQAFFHGLRTIPVRLSKPWDNPRPAEAKLSAYFIHRS
jgi:hypothetical protein